MFTRTTLLVVSLFLLESTVIAQDNTTAVNQWHTKTLTFPGPETSESATPNPFTDFRLLVTFRHDDVTYKVRGFYAADGNAAESSADSGKVWKARFSPDRPGKWTYSASLRKGSDIAISDKASAGVDVELSNSSGSFVVEPNGSTKGLSLDFRDRGRLVASGKYLRFGEQGPHWLKGGADSPENLLAYADFDGTYRISTETTDGEAKASVELHRYATHVRDWQTGDAEWRDGKGHGLVGGLNYLSSSGVNAIYFLTFNIGGDGKDVWPYASPDDFTRFDCSKLDQWEIVFEHMQRKGILMHVVTQETENERTLDDGDTSRLRKLYYRELIARFAHHPALVWNLGEENGPADFSPDGQTATQQKAMADYIKASDPYRHPVVIHTHSTVKGKDEVITDLLGHATIDGLSFQVDKPSMVNQEVRRWHKLANDSKRPWLISMDEIGPWHTGVVPDADDPDHATLRREVLWGSLMAGAAGVEWYFGAKFPHNDLTSEDWRQRANMWKQTKHALDFFESNLSYWKMKPTNLAAKFDGYCFADEGEAYAIYVPPGKLRDDHPLKVDLAGSREFNVRWYDPRNGGSLQRGSVSKAKPTDASLVGLPPNELDRDWVLMLK